ncbi:SPW repeat protein [Streptomyces collinus]|uniref:SPW repeat protein n=1 Tax=Streptomyces collinus TaxID=42684 RepID=UPI003EBFAF6E
MATVGGPDGGDPGGTVPGTGGQGLAGISLAASPWITGFNNLSTLAVTNLLVGPRFGRAYERTHNMAWGACVLGAWTIITPWVAAGSVSTTKTIVNHIITGAVALLLALAASVAAQATEQRTRARAGMSAQYYPMGRQGRRTTHLLPGGRLPTGPFSRRGQTRSPAGDHVTVIMPARDLNLAGLTGAE